MLKAIKKHVGKKDERYGVVSVPRAAKLANVSEELIKQRIRQEKRYEDEAWIFEPSETF